MHFICIKFYYILYMYQVYQQEQYNSHMNNQESLINHQKGLAYEIQIRDHILKNNQCYLWSDCPETLLLEHKIINSHNDINNKKPSTHDKNKNIKQLGQWLSDQQNKYKKKLL